MRGFISRIRKESVFRLSELDLTPGYVADEFNGGCTAADDYREQPVWASIPGRLTTRGVQPQRDLVLAATATGPVARHG